MQSRRIAITHANGSVAEALLKRLAESGLDPDSLVLLDQSEASGNRLAYKDTHLEVLDQSEYDFEDLLAVVLCETDRVLEELLVHAECCVIGQNLQSHLPSVFVGDASDSSLELPVSGFVSVPDALQSTLLEVLRPFQALSPLRNLSLVAVQSAGVRGKAGIEELASQTISLLNSRDVDARLFPLQIAFNMLPEDSDLDAGQQLAELLGDAEIGCDLHKITVPAFHGLAISVTLEFTAQTKVARLVETLQNDERFAFSNQMISPVTHCQESNKTWIYGLQSIEKDVNRLQFWIMADSAENGLVRNYYNILHILLNSFL